MKRQEGARESSSALWLVAIVVLILIGLGFRVWGIDWGFPYAFHPDEHKLVKRALAFGKGDLNPHYFTWPSLLMYVMFFIYGCYYALGWLVGHFTSPEDLIVEFAVNPQNFFLLARGLSALLGTATIWMTYRIGQKLYGREVGLLAAVLLTVNYLHVMYSHYITMDVPATFMVIVAFWFAIKISEEPELKHYVAAGLLTGLAISVKYPAFVISFALLAAHLIAVRTQPGMVRLFSARAWLAAVLIPLAFVFGTPYSVLDWDTFLTDLLVTQTETSRPLTMVATAVALFFTNPLLVLGGGVYICSIAGVFRCLFRRGRTELLLLSFPVVYLSLLLAVGGLRPRDLTPLLPFFAILVGLFLVDAVGFLTRAVALPRVVGPTLVVAATIALVFQPVSQSLALVLSLVRPDTRVEAKAWIEHNIPAGTRIGVESYGPPLVPISIPIQEDSQPPDPVEEWQKNKGKITEHIAYVRVKGARQGQAWRKYNDLIDKAKSQASGTSPHYRIFTFRHLPAMWWLKLQTGQVREKDLNSVSAYQYFFKPESFLAENQIEYVVLSSSTPSSERLKTLLEQQAELVQRVHKSPPLGWVETLPFSGLHNPTLEIYKLKP